MALYFFAQYVIVLSHGCAKERSLPEREIERALRNREAFARDPDAHTFRPRTGAI